MVSKKRATINNNSNNNTKCKRNLGNCIHRGMQLLHDGTPTHWERSTTAYLNANNVYVVDFSPKSQDLSIIEIIWDELNRCVRRTGVIPTTLNQLRAKILYDRNILPQNYVQRFVTSMRCRCLAVVNSAGTYSLLSLHGYGRRCRIWLKNIMIFTCTLFCDMYDQVWSLLKHWKMWTLIER